MSSSHLRQLRALDIDGVSYAKFGTSLWALAAVLAWVTRDWLAAQGLTEAPQICTAGFVLGLIGLNHVTRRKRRITLRQQQEVLRQQRETH